MLGQQHVAHVSRILRQVHVLDKAMMMLVRMYQQYFLGCAATFVVNVPTIFSWMCSGIY